MPFFSSSNEYGIPDLLPDMLAGMDCVPRDIWCGEDTDYTYTDKLVLWSTLNINNPLEGGILGFYVEDYRFESLWFDAVRILETLKSKKLKAIIEPDFSVWRDAPAVLQMYNRYRSQWVARYWQGVGFKVIPSLSWSDERSYDFCCAGVPEGCELVSLQCRTTRSRKGKEYFVKGITETLKRLKPQNVLLYGGDSHRSWIEPYLGSNLIKGEYIWLGDWITMRMHKRRQKHD